MLINKKIILITGSTDGIGKETAIKLLEVGAHVIIHGRNLKKAKLFLKEIRSKTGLNSISAVYGDLSSIDQILDMADQVNKKFNRLDILINNAGIYRNERSVSQNGIEETLAVNYIAPFILTNLLLELLKKGKSSRIINVVSQVHSNQLEFKNLQLEIGYTAVKAYAHSKTCLIMFTYLLAEKLKNSAITVNCLHPGVINTKLLDAAMGMVGAPGSIGADNLIHAVTASELEGITSKYLNMKHIEPSKDITYNKEIQVKLWQKTEEIIGMKFKDF